jgi:hypothetical protein
VESAKSRSDFLFFCRSGFGSGFNFFCSLLFCDGTFCSRGPFVTGTFSDGTFCDGSLCDPILKLGYVNKVIDKCKYIFMSKRRTRQE